MNLIEKNKTNWKKGLVKKGKNLTYTLLACSSILFSGCGKDPVNVKIIEETGNITGKVLWDPQRDGTYEPASRAEVERYGPDYEGGFPPHKATGSAGTFSFQEVCLGSHELKAIKFTDNPYNEWKGHTSVEVNPGETSVAEDIYLQPVF